MAIKTKIIRQNNMIQENLYIKDYIKPVLDKLYENDAILFENNLCERCIVFRFAYYLQNKFDNDHDNDYFVDCDYNSSTYFDKEEGKLKRRNGKPIPNSDQGKAEIKKRFIDIIVHKRSANNSKNRPDLICFEIKKWNNFTKKKVEKDRNNLKVLTSQYGYKYGFHLIFGKVKDNVRVEIFKNGKGITKGKIYNRQGI